MRILITGGAGFIGSHLAAYHLNKGDFVIVVDDLSTGDFNNIKEMVKHPNFCFYKKNLVTWRGLGNALLNVDRVYHMAAVVGMFHVVEHPIDTLNVNINGTLKLFEAIHRLGIKPLVLVASSSEVYGDQHKKLSETSALILEGSNTSHASYAIAKLSEESIALAFWHKCQIPCIVLRIFNTVGRNQRSRYGMVIPRLIKQAIHNENITVFGDGTQKRAFCNVNDTVNLIELLANNPECVGQIVNVGNNEELCINDLAALIRKISLSQSSIVHVPFEEVYHNDVMNITERCPNLTRLMHFTHYRHQWTIEKTISDIVSYETGR